MNPTPSDSGNHRAARWLSLAVALLWAVGFSVWFSRFDLPNNHVARSALWQASPFDVMDLLDPPRVPGEAPWGWAFLVQRIPLLLTAIAIWAGAWGQGSLILRCLPLRLHVCERLFFAFCTGLSSVSLTMLCLGLCGGMSQWPLLILLLVPFLCAAIIDIRNLLNQTRSLDFVGHAHGRLFPQWSWIGWCVVIALVPFVFGAMLGAMSPQTDFDVVEYHLGGPKEWFQQGHIARLPHNVYTSFPFLTEMLILCGMVLYGDWQWGALAGQLAISGFAPVAALGVFAFCRRWFSEESGWLAALVYLTSPWTYRISIIAYAESGLACYLFAALSAVLLFRDRIRMSDAERNSPLACAFLAGLMAGSAMACKYTAAYAVVAPTGLLLFWFAASKNRYRTVRYFAISASLFAMGVMAAVGPWLLKNTVETGNPLYPLAVRIFGGIDRDPRINAKWMRGHAAKSYHDWQERLSDLPVKLIDVVCKNDWHSPLMFALAPLSLFWVTGRLRKKPVDSLSVAEQPPIVGIVWIYVGWQFVTWWILTHHIDRFYVPMFPAVAALAGIGARWWESQPNNPNAFQRALWRIAAGIMIVASLFYNAEVMVAFHGAISGFNAGRMDLKTASDIAVAPRIKWLNDAWESGRLPPSTKVLCVGEALMFHARFPYLYNTVFDHSIFERICADPDSNDHRMRSAEAIRDDLKRLGITLVDVNWSEILRYREPGNYGYTDFVHPDRFDQLQQMGILGPPLNLPAPLVIAPLDDDLRNRLEKWAPSLITTYEGKPAYINAQIFPVLDRTP